MSKRGKEYAEVIFFPILLYMRMLDCLEQFLSVLGKAEPVKFSRILRRAIRIGGEGYPVKKKVGKANAEAKNYSVYLWIVLLHVFPFTLL